VKRARDGRGEVDWLPRRQHKDNRGNKGRDGPANKCPDQSDELSDSIHVSLGSGTHLMVPVGDLRAILGGGTHQKGLRIAVRPVTRLRFVLLTNRVAIFNSPEHRQNPHHQMCASAYPY